MASPEHPVTPPDLGQEESHNRQTIDAYDADASGYEANTIVDPSEHHAARTWIDYALSVLDERPELAHLSVLEIGSGTGRDADYLESCGVSVRRTDAVPAFVQAQRSKGHAADTLNALTDTLGGPYRMIFANGVFPHFSDGEARFVIDKAFANLAPDGLFAFSVKVTDVLHHWEQGTIEGWDVAIPSHGQAVPAKLNAERYYYVRHPLDARLLADHGGLERSITFMPYNTERSQWLGAVVCKDGFGDIPDDRPHRHMPFPPLPNDV
jgi:SAM-dependent methyltransferase